MVLDRRRRAVARRILRAYLARNDVALADVEGVFLLISEALHALPDRHTPIVSKSAVLPTPDEIAASIRPEGLTSFIDGRAYKILKPHLRAHGLYPVDYRERYGLPGDYPMACTDYGAQRAGIAKRMGLGGSRAYLRDDR